MLKRSSGMWGVVLKFFWGLCLGVPLFLKELLRVSSFTRGMDDKT